MVQGENNKDRHTKNLTGCHPSRLIGDPTPIIPTIFTPDAIPVETLPIHPGLGQAPTMLACILSGLFTKWLDNMYSYYYCDLSNCYIFSKENELKVCTHTSFMATKLLQVSELKPSNLNSVNTLTNRYYKSNITYNNCSRKCSDIYANFHMVHLFIWGLITVKLYFVLHTCMYAYMYTIHTHISPPYHIKAKCVTRCTFLIQCYLHKSENKFSERMW